MELDENPSSGGGGVSSTSTTFSDRSTPERFARAVLDTLAAGNKTEFQRIIIPPKHELIGYLRTNAKGRTASEQRSLDRSTDSLERLYDSKQREIHASFDKTLSTLKRAGFDWSRLSITKTTYSIRTRGGIQTTTGIYVSFNDGRRYYRLKIDDTMRVYGNWCSINDGLRLYPDYTRRSSTPRSRFRGDSK